MFNVLIANNTTYWESDQFMHMDRDRFGEHSRNEIKAVDLDNPATFSLLEKARSLLLYENGAIGDSAHIVRVGHVYDISADLKEVRFRFHETGRLQRDVVTELSHLLDLSNWELNRTHWAVKDGDIPRTVLEKVEQTFDVFICHNSLDKQAIVELGTALKSQGLRVWIDIWELPPGRRWQDELEKIVSTCKAAAICVGGNGIGPWADMEMRGLIGRFVAERQSGKMIPIIPTLLPGAPASVELPLFLSEFSWVNLRDGLTDDNIARLEWGITGIRPLRLG